MVFAKLIENPEEMMLTSLILGTILSQGLTFVELGVLARLINNVSDVVATFAVLAAARDIEITAKLTTDKDNIIKTKLDNTQAIIKELQQQNQNLQEQIWTLQEKCH